MSEIKLSVIVAVYNIEQDVEACLQSILQQPLKGCEVIVVDDGSTDQSGAICDRYAAQQENVRVFHKENGGLSDARNFGLQKARGKYVWFVDGDDRIVPEACAEFCREAEESGADVMIGKAMLSKSTKAMERFESIAETRFQMHTSYSGRDYLLGCLQGGALRVEVWRNLYRRAFLVQQHLCFRRGIAHEDEEFTPRVLLAAQNVVLTNRVVYRYNNDRAGSIMNSHNPQKALDKMTIYTEQLKRFQTVKPRKLRRLLEDDLSWKYMDCYCAYRMGTFAQFAPNRFLPFRCAFHLKRRVKAAIFAISPNLYAKYF